MDEQRREWSFVANLGDDPEWSELGQSLRQPVAVASVEVEADLNDLAPVLAEIRDDVAGFRLAGWAPPALYLVRWRVRTRTSRHLGVWGDLPAFRTADTPRTERVREFDGGLECAGLAELKIPALLDEACLLATNAHAAIVLRRSAADLDGMLGALLEERPQPHIMEGFWVRTIDSMVAAGCVCIRLTAAHDEVSADAYGSRSDVEDLLRQTKVAFDHRE